MAQGLGLLARQPCLAAAAALPAQMASSPSAPSTTPRSLRSRRPARWLTAGASRRHCRAQRQPAVQAASGSGTSSGMWVPPSRSLELPDAADVIAPQIVAYGAPGVAAERGGSYDEHKAKSPPPDLPSLMLDARIVYVGMPLVSAVTELIIAELLYLQYKDRKKPMNMYINSTGTTRADGEAVGFETEATAIFDTMSYVGNEINTVGVGVAIGQSCMLLSAGTKGKRFMLPHATAMLHQPRVPPTGQRQAVEIAIKWREVLAQKNAFLEILSKTTGHSTAKLDKDMQRPLYMRPLDAIEYGVIDRLVPPQKELEIIDQIKSPEAYDKEAGLVTRPASQF